MKPFLDHGVQFPVAEAKLMFDQTWLIKSQGQFLAFTVANGMDRYIYSIFRYSIINNKIV